MAIGLLFGGFWFGLGVLMWWWPAAIFVAFSNDDVTPGARAFAAVAIFIGVFFLTLDVPGLGGSFTLPGTLLTVGLLFLLKPVGAPGVNPRGPVTPKVAGVALLVVGTLLAVQSLT
ncbi:hypothetical protein M0R89_20060 (plasmid) [Halorussus limi]|uniref:Uncharacterized protein n=1 Tax=Halorussus limi TaxID=2938695 RepID=A0A8U0HZZ0_9EURY|nr:hypothetical protein [Halorussus limi]UPV76459.1 hypothetical protein M0R89_20060 [Halorussus limi]